MPAARSRVPFPLEAIAAYPAPGMAVPSSFAFTPDDTHVLYLAAGEGNIQHLYALDIATGAMRVIVTPPGGGTQEEGLSPEEELRRQRERMLATGITHYSCATNSNRLLIPLSGDLFVQDGLDASLRQLVATAGSAPALNGTLSPDGAWVAYVQDVEIMIVPTEGGTPLQITQGARGTGRTHGIAEYIAQEELGRAEGYWWSPDSRSIAYAEVDETDIPLYRIMHQGQDDPAAAEEHRYPFTGAANAKVRLAIVPITGGAPVGMDIDIGEEMYLVRVCWWPDGTLGALLLKRAQTQMDLVRFNGQTGERTTVLRETSEYWINVWGEIFHPLADGRFLWTSERTGFNHLYLYGADGTLMRQLTKGDWVVDDIAGVDQKGEIAYFMGNREHPTEMHLYAVPLAGGKLRRITQAAGTHAVTLDHRCQHFVDSFSALDTPPQVTLRTLKDGTLISAISTSTDVRIKQYKLGSPEVVTLKNRGGVTLYGAVYRPPARYGPGPHPTIIDVYGGPGPQRVANRWDLTADLKAQYLRALGFLVFRLDNRGSALRGLAFESALQHHMGTVEVDDQVDGVRWLVAQGLADETRVGVMGWSYGGFMALMCLAKAPETFRVAVAGAPVTAFDGYDTCYTERYMGTPQSNPDGYAGTNVMKYVDQIQGKLLLIHGMLDENVHFRHTARLVNALIHARKPYDLLLFPNERHMPRHLPDRVYLNERLIGYFQQHLQKSRQTRK